MALGFLSKSSVRCVRTKGRYVAVFIAVSGFKHSYASPLHGPGCFRFAFSLIPGGTGFRQPCPSLTPAAYLSALANPETVCCWERGGLAFLLVFHAGLAVKGGAHECACGRWPS